MVVLSLIFALVFCQAPSREQALRDYQEIGALLDDADQLPAEKRWFSPQSQEAERRLNAMSPEQRQLFDQVEQEQIQKIIQASKKPRSPESKAFSERADMVTWVLCVGGFLLVVLIGFKVKRPNYGTSVAGQVAAEGAVTVKLFLLGALLAVVLLIVGPCVICCIDPTIH